MTGLLDHPDHPTGSLEPGKLGDIVLGELHGEPGAYRFEVRQVFVHGRAVALAPAPTA